MKKISTRSQYPTSFVSQHRRLENSAGDLGHDASDLDAEVLGVGILLESVAETFQVLQDLLLALFRRNGREPGRRKTSNSLWPDGCCQIAN